MRRRTAGTSRRRSSRASSRCRDRACDRAPWAAPRSATRRSRVTALAAPACRAPGSTGWPCRRRPDDGQALRRGRGVSGALRAATDVGGTFTDLVAFSTDPRPGGRRSSPPRQARRPDSSAASWTCSKSGITIADVDSRPRDDARDQCDHGTEGVKTGLITTAGFRDSLNARGNRPDYFNLHYQKPPVRAPLPPAEVRAPGARRPGAGAARSLRPALDRRGLPRRRRRGGRHLPASRLRRSEPRGGGARGRPGALAGGLRRRVAPDHARVARVRAHEHRRPVGVRAAARRSSTSRASPSASRLGVRRTALHLQSNCGVDSVEKTRRSRSRWSSRALRAAWGAAELGRLIEPNVLALDIGGTTAKCSM